MTQRRWDTTKRAIWFTLGGIAVALTMLWLQSAPTVTPEDHRYGLADNWQELAAPIIAAHPPFQLVDAEGNAIVQDNATANVRFWEVWQKNGLSLPANYPQKIGDCTSFGAKNAIENRQGVEIGEGGDIRFRAVYPPFLYGAGRVFIGKGAVRGDGAVGAWVARAAKEHGILFADDPGVPAYDTAVAREWGLKGPPKAFVEIAKTRRVKTIAPVKTAIQCRDAICNGYPVTVASMFGTTDIRERDGRMVARRNTQWAHQMCCVGYDGRGPVAYFYVLNSWGEAAHPRPLQGEPPGGFWVTVDDMQWICSTGDCWSFSDLDGFPARELDFNVFGAVKAAPRGVASLRKTGVAL